MSPQLVRQLQDAFRFATEQTSFLNVLEQGSLRPWYMSAPQFREFAERAEREQKALMSKYGFAKKAA